MVNLEDERQAAIALGPDRDRLDRLVRERRADVERIAEALYVLREGPPLLEGELSPHPNFDPAAWAFARAEAFVAERDRRRES